VRFLDHSGAMSFFEGAPPDVAVGARAVVASATEIIALVSPWDKKRLPPPTSGVRLTLLASDGLYFAEGPWDQMSRDPKAAPIILKASELLQLVVKATSPR
jgi:hypothetical protein